MKQSSSTRLLAPTSESKLNPGACLLLLDRSYLFDMSFPAGLIQHLSFYFSLSSTNLPASQKMPPNHGNDILTEMTGERGAQGKRFKVQELPQRVASFGFTNFYPAADGVHAPNLSRRST